MPGERLQRDTHLIHAWNQLRAERFAAALDIGEFRGFLGQAARNGLVPIIVTHELEAGADDRLPRDGSAHHHADPIAMLATAMTGMERKAAQAIEDRPA